MQLSDSLLSSVKLRSKPKRFLTLLGVTPEQFDEIFEQFYDLHVKNQVKRNRLEPADRVCRRIARQRSTLQEHLCITLLYLRQYNTQEILAATFDLSQGQISKIINRTTILLEAILPVPEKLSKLVLNYLKTLDPATRRMYKATLIIDASEQRVERNQDNEKQRVDYSGKKSVIVENSK